MTAVSPLFVPRPADPRLRAACQAVEARLAPFREADLIASVDAHVVARLGLLTEQLDPELLLALAFAVRAPRAGHICADLLELEADDPQLALPTDRQVWLQQVAAATPLVRTRHAAGQRTPFVLDGSLLYTDRYWSYQQRLAERLRQWADEPARPPINPAALAHALEALFRPPGEPAQRPTRLSRQAVAGAMALLRRLTVVTGGPGMGKTWTVRNILALLWLEHRLAARPGDAPLRVGLAAPTGKAAARMREAIRDQLDSAFLPRLPEALGDVAAPAEVRAFMLDLEPRTLHRLLGWRADNPTRFRHDADHPLHLDAVIVDETSMVDFALLAKLVDAIGPATRLILIGDRHQLASVEAGTALADLCGPTRADELRLSEPFVADLANHLDAAPAGRVAHVAERGLCDSIVQLERNYRFPESSGIGTFAAACLRRDFDPAAATAILTDEQHYQDVALLPHGEHGALGRPAEPLIVDGFGAYLELLLAGPDATRDRTQEVFHRRVLTQLDRFRILCAHRRGRLGVEGLNERAASLLAQRFPALDLHERFWPGRPILVTRNDYAVKRFNGDVGVVVLAGEGNDRRPMVAFPGPDSLPDAETLASLSDEALADLALVEYLAPSRLPEHVTTFAMTIHKSQGSEFEHVMVVLPDGPSRILTRELVYTGVTRARRRMTMLGDPAILESALARRVRRASGLRAEVW